MRKRSYTVVLIVAALLIVAAIALRGRGAHLMAQLAPAIHGRGGGH
jgi:hypothetical protein